jgi:hypothetical protein
MGQILHGSAAPSVGNAAMGVPTRRANCRSALCQGTTQRISG